MFFELEDIRRRRQPTWGLNNTTGWHTAVDSTVSWNMQRGNHFPSSRFPHWLHNYLYSRMDK